MRHAFPCLTNDLSVLFVIFLVSTLFLVAFFPLEQKKCRLETEWFGGGGLGAMLDHLSFHHPYFLFRRAPPGFSTFQDCFFGLVTHMYRLECVRTATIRKLCATKTKIIIKNKAKRRPREQYSTACYVVVHSHKDG